MMSSLTLAITASMTSPLAGGPELGACAAGAGAGGAAGADPGADPGGATGVEAPSGAGTEVAARVGTESEPRTAMAGMADATAAANVEARTARLRLFMGLRSEIIVISQALNSGPTFYARRPQSRHRSR